MNQLDWAERLHAVTADYMELNGELGERIRQRLASKQRHRDAMALNLAHSRVRGALVTAIQQAFKASAMPSRPTRSTCCAISGENTQITPK